MPTTPRPFAPSSSCNALQRGATPRNAVQPIHAFGKTNPIFEPDDPPADSALAALKSAVGAAAQKLAPAVAAACNVVQHGATPRDVVQRNSSACKTNPIPQIQLDARQLAAARLLATGRSVAQAAQELQLNRTTVWRWQRDPVFRDELRRIHERMVIAQGARR